MVPSKQDILFEIDDYFGFETLVYAVGIAQQVTHTIHVV